MIYVILTIAEFALAFVLILRLVKVSGYIRVLAGVSKRVCRGDGDVVIPAFSRAPGNITAIAGALRRATERIRVLEGMGERAQAIKTARLQFDLFVKEANCVSQAFKMTLAALRYQMEPLKITMVYANPEPVYSLVSRKAPKGGREIIEAESFPYHEEVSALLAGKRSVFLNPFAIAEQNVLFLDKKARAACLLALAANGKNLGYLVIENESGTELAASKSEGFWLWVAGELAAWLEEYQKTEDGGQKTDKNQSVAFKEPATCQVSAGDRNQVTDKNQYSASKEPSTQGSGSLPSFTAPLFDAVDGLDAYTALENMGGAADVYENAIRMFVKIFPEIIASADACFVKLFPKILVNKDKKLVKLFPKISENAGGNAFAVEIHSIKGALNNIGAYELGDEAAAIEDAAKSGDAALCKEEYPRFKERALKFHKAVADALPNAERVEKPSGDIDGLKPLLEKAKEAAAGFDALLAKQWMVEAAGKSYGPEIDLSIEKVIDSLERFDCVEAEQGLEVLL